jgi:hypothetical protein
VTTTAAARFAQSVQAGALIAVFGTLTAFATGALLAGASCGSFKDALHRPTAPHQHRDCSAD